MAAGLRPWLLALALALWPAGLWAQVRLQEAGGRLRVAGESVTLSCRLSNSTFEGYTFWWYRQAPGGSLESVSRISYNPTAFHFDQSVQGRAKISRDNSRSEVYLSLLPLHTRDSARYFCAVHTGTGNPDIPNTSAPQVIVMKSKKLEEGGSTGKAACLARNFLTKNIRLEMPSKEVVYKQSTSILTSEGLYNAVKVVKVTKGTEVTCTAKFDNSTITTEPAGRAERCFKASERNGFNYLITWRDLTLQRRGKSQSICSKCEFPYD
ncbi:immunoglobulin gamma-1 heavy chain-like isoform X2 [Chamaea fasciata]|uniref:immunoglobulin gamma-1 heavy chain-like isoform X2 n=1 Tax=Chamaea fasciata TaxID=190680 RepID=UPI00336A58B7